MLSLLAAQAVAADDGDLGHAAPPAEARTLATAEGRLRVLAPPDRPTLQAIDPLLLEADGRPARGLAATGEWHALIAAGAEQRRPPQEMRLATPQRPTSLEIASPLAALSHRYQPAPRIKLDVAQPATAITPATATELTIRPPREPAVQPVSKPQDPTFRVAAEAKPEPAVRFAGPSLRLVAEGPGSDGTVHVTAHAADAAASAPPEKPGEPVVELRRMRLVRAKADIEATLVVDESVCKIVPVTAREAWLVAKAAGTTRVAFRFQDDRQPPFTCVVRVSATPASGTPQR